MDFLFHSSFADIPHHCSKPLWLESFLEVIAQDRMIFHLDIPLVICTNSESYVHFDNVTNFLLQTPFFCTTLLLLQTKHAMGSKVYVECDSIKFLSLEHTTLVRISFISSNVMVIF